MMGESSVNGHQVHDGNNLYIFIYYNFSELQKDNQKIYYGINNKHALQL